MEKVLVLDCARAAKYAFTMNDDGTPKKHSWPGRVLMLVRRLAILVAVGFAIGWVLNRTEAALERRAEPAGFVRGLVQGALMPMSMPNLLFAHDVAIYAANNTGRPYKLGYTMGVNGCGLIFFGFFFWRVRRMKLQVMNAAKSNGMRTTNSASSELEPKV